MTDLSRHPICWIKELSSDEEGGPRHRAHDTWCVAEATTGTSSIDIYETPEAYLLTADLPGVKAEDIGLEIGRRHVVLSGFQRFQRHEGGGQPGERKRIGDRFRRYFELGHLIDETRADLFFSDTLCEARLPKRKEGRESE